MMQVSRVLTDALKNDLRSGVLAPLLEAVRSDRDLNMEFRGECADIYYKGYRLHLKSCGGHGYKISVNEAFREKESESPTLTSPEDVYQIREDRVVAHKMADGDALCPRTRD